MMTPTLPGYKVECVGDDICWMRFDEEGKLRAINPEYGFFGVAPGMLLINKKLKNINRKLFLWIWLLSKYFFFLRNFRKYESERNENNI